MNTKYIYNSVPFFLFSFRYWSISHNTYKHFIWHLGQQNCYYKELHEVETLKYQELDYDPYA